MNELEKKIRDLGYGDYVDFIKAAHAGQTRKQGTPYYLHPVAVAATAHEWLGDQAEFVIKVALFHDILEDTAVTFDELADKIGFVAADAVKMLSKAPKTKGNNYTRAIDSYRIIANSPIEVRLVKFADRLHNLSELASAPMSFRESYLADTQKLLSTIKEPQFAWHKVEEKYWEECSSFYGDYYGKV